MDKEARRKVNFVMKEVHKWQLLAGIACCYSNIYGRPRQYFYIKMTV